MPPLMDNNGYFVPFMDPIVAPAASVLDQPRTCVMFNENWLPLVVGALKVLARPETYLDGVQTATESSAEGQNLLGMVGDCPPCEDLIPNWWLSMESNADYLVSTLLPAASCVVKKRYYAFATHMFDPSTGNNDIHIYGADNAGAAGGVIDIYLTVDPPGRVYSVHTINCLGTENFYSDVTDGSNLALNYTNMKSVQVYFENTAFMFGTAIVTDDAVCSNA